MNNVYVATADRDFSTIKSKLADAGPVRWIYLARDHNRARQLHEALGAKCVAIGYSRMLDEVASEIRSEHIAWIDGLNRDNGDKLNWWFGAISTRNVYSSNLFLYSCYLLVLQRLWNNPDTRPALIIADSPGLAKCVRNWLASSNPDVRIIDLCSSWSASMVLRPLVGYARAIAVAGARYFAALITKPGSATREENGDQVVIDTFVHENSISAAGVFRDRYFPFLHEFLESRGYQVLVHPVLFKFGVDFVSIYRRMRKSRTRFIVQEDYLRLADYAAALLAPIALLFTRVKSGPFKGINLDPVVREEHLFQDLVPVAQAVLINRLWRRLREAGTRCSRLIDWYENQVVDKALIRGMREAYPGSRIVGVQMFLHCPNFLNQYPTESERESGLAPDIVLAIGKCHAEIATKYSPSIPCLPAAALRYAYLFENVSSGTGMADRQAAIVVLLPFKMDESLEILDLLLTAALGSLAGAVFQVKCHPDFSPEDLMHAFGRAKWPNALHIYAGGLAAAFDQAAMVISSNSGSIVEAAVLGIPIILLARQSNLNMNPLAEIPGAKYATCYDADQLSRAIVRFLGLQTHEREQFRREGRALRDNLFARVDDRGLSRFLS